MFLHIIALNRQQILRVVNGGDVVAVQDDANGLGGDVEIRALSGRVSSFGCGGVTRRTKSLREINSRWARRSS
jgi:hypothetical protein